MGSRDLSQEVDPEPLTASSSQSVQSLGDSVSLLLSQASQGHQSSLSFSYSCSAVRHQSRQVDLFVHSPVLFFILFFCFFLSVFVLFDFFRRPTWLYGSISSHHYACGICVFSAGFTLKSTSTEHSICSIFSGNLSLRHPDLDAGKQT